MRVEALNIERPRYGEDLGKLVGTITLVDDGRAKLEIPLTHAGISRLIQAIALEVQNDLTYIASQAPRALQQAQDEGNLLEHNGEINF